MAVVAAKMYMATGSAGSRVHIRGALTRRAPGHDQNDRRGKPPALSEAEPAPWRPWVPRGYSSPSAVPSEIRKHPGSGRAMQAPDGLREAEGRFAVRLEAAVPLSAMLTSDEGTGLPPGVG